VGIYAIPFFIVVALLAMWALPAGYCCMMGVDRACFRRGGNPKDRAILISLVLFAIVATFLAYWFWSNFQ